MEVETEGAEMYVRLRSNRRHPSLRWVGGGRRACRVVAVDVRDGCSGRRDVSDKNVTTAVMTTSATPKGKKSAQ